MLGMTGIYAWRTGSSWSSSHSARFCHLSPNALEQYSDGVAVCACLWAACHNKAPGS